MRGKSETGADPASDEANEPWIADDQPERLLDSNYSPPDHKEDNGQEADFQMQGNTAKDCTKRTDYD